DRNRSHWSTSKTPSYTKSVSWQHHHKNNMRHFCITNKKKQKTSIFIFGQWVFWPIVVIVLLVIIFILPAYWSVINFDQL
ncbi:hypothetical protein, partial [Escherichia coli]|uniref:hypothetical protein n=1 Tax=Escherichia coli TaxID=562 RepID=UPI001F4DB798